MTEETPSNLPTLDAPSSIFQIITHLKSDNDTSRFVGLALLHPTINNSPTLQSTPKVLTDLWQAIPSTFLDRLLRAQRKQSSKNKDQAKEMVNLAVGVLSTFASLLPKEVLDQPWAAERVRGLIGALLYCGEEQERRAAATTTETQKTGTTVDTRSTVERILATLKILASTNAGAEVFIDVEDLGSLAEISPRRSEVFEVLSMAWLTAQQHPEMEDPVFKKRLEVQMAATLQSLMASFLGTDGVTLLTFIGEFLPQADPTLFPPNPKWLPSTITFIEKLIRNRPTPESRYAYTLSTAALLSSFSTPTKDLLFTPRKAPSTGSDSKPIIFILINLFLIDICTSLPSLLSLLNNPTTAQTTRRLTAAYDAALHYLTYMLSASETDELPMPIDLLYKTRDAYIETLTITTEYLRDRWNAATIGAPGLDSAARSEKPEDIHRTITWDSATVAAATDPMVLAAVRMLAVWISEDDVPALMRAAIDLVDMFIEVYRESMDERVFKSGVDFREAVLMALGAILSEKDGRRAFKEHGGWAMLTGDLLQILDSRNPLDIHRGCSVGPMLLTLLHEESNGSTASQEWLDFTTKLAAWSGGDGNSGEDGNRMFVEVTALKVAVKVLKVATKGQRKGYIYTMGALSGLEVKMRERVCGGSGEKEGIVADLDEVRRHLDALRD